MAAAGNRRPFPAPTSSEEWGRRLRRGEAEAVQNVRERVRRILSYRQIKIPHHMRDDLEQEIMTDLWQAVNRSSFDFSAGFWGFVETVSARRCIDWLRAQRENVPVVENIRDKAKTPLESVLSGERSELASQVLEALDPACRKIITMRLKEGISYRDMAQILGRSEGALRVQMHRCIQNARNIVETVSPTLGREVGEGGSDESS